MGQMEAGSGAAEREKKLEMRAVSVWQRAREEETVEGWNGRGNDDERGRADDGCERRKWDWGAVGPCPRLSGRRKIWENPPLLCSWGWAEIGVLLVRRGLHCRLETRKRRPWVGAEFLIFSRKRGIQWSWARGERLVASPSNIQNSLYIGKILFGPQNWFLNFLFFLKIWFSLIFFCIFENEQYQRRLNEEN